MRCALSDVDDPDALGGLDRDMNDQAFGRILSRAHVGADRFDIGRDTGRS
jgi:hypothetical protein